MNKLLHRRLKLLQRTENRPLLAGGLRGIEREALRVTGAGQLAQTPHPQALGSALCHAQITTDYSESLLEFITPPSPSSAACLDALSRIHRFSAAKLQGQRLWSASMPGLLPDEAHIPIARYGTSNSGRMKYVYRKGLALRYGKTMQCIAGIHYNFSLDERLFALLQKDEGDTRSAQDYQSYSYIALVRNFRRLSWLLMYLFGASPVLDKSFMRGAAHGLQSLDETSLYLPHATSLRMSDLGYQSNAQRSLTPCYNDLASYTDSLHRAVSTPWPPYAALGTHDAQGNWQQLSCNILQIENEYYSSIRPKRVTQSGERPLDALLARGVQYIEVRCLDINPFLPLGIDLEQALFLDTFLLLCALRESPLLSPAECSEATDNFLQTVRTGRAPGLHLSRLGQALPLADWGRQIVEDCAPIAELLDSAQGGDAYRRSLAAQQAKLEDPEQTPSARVLAHLRASGESFAAFALAQSARHAAHFAGEPLGSAEQAAFEHMAAVSLKKQAELESARQEDFDRFIATRLGQDSRQK